MVSIAMISAITDPASMRPGRPVSGSVIAEIIAIDTINHHRITRRFGNGPQMQMQLSLAGKAAIRGIAAVLGILQFGRGTFAMPNADPAGLSSGLLKQMRSQGW